MNLLKILQACPFLVQIPSTPVTCLCNRVKNSFDANDLTDSILACIYEQLIKVFLVDKDKISFTFSSFISYYTQLVLYDFIRTSTMLRAGLLLHFDFYYQRIWQQINKVIISNRTTAPHAKTIIRLAKVEDDMPACHSYRASYHPVAEHYMGNKMG